LNRGDAETQRGLFKVFISPRLGGFIASWFWFLQAAGGRRGLRLQLQGLVQIVSGQLLGQWPFGQLLEGGMGHRIRRPPFGNRNGLKEQALTSGF
jgi:hypothetical protein